MSNRREGKPRAKCEKRGNMVLTGNVSVYIRGGLEEPECQ